MFLNRSALVFFLLSCSFFTTSAATWTTINAGFWNSTYVWFGGIVPPYSSSDTFLIQHPVAIDTTITLLSGSVFQIDSTGGICGHETMIMQSNTLLTIYGILELDTLYVDGGDVIADNPGDITLTLSGIVSNGGTMQISCMMAVGPWFNCQLPEYSFLTGNAEIQASSISVYPNPASTGISIDVGNKPSRLILRCLDGRIATTSETKAQHAFLSVSEIPSGTYFLEISDSSGQLIGTKKVVVLH